MATTMIGFNVEEEKKEFWKGLAGEQSQTLTEFIIEAITLHTTFSKEMRDALDDLSTRMMVPKTTLIESIFWRWKAEADATGRDLYEEFQHTSRGFVVGKELYQLMRQHFQNEIEKGRPLEKKDPLAGLSPEQKAGVEKGLAYHRKKSAEARKKG